MRLLLPALLVVSAPLAAAAQDEEEAIELREDDFEVIEEGDAIVLQEQEQEAPGPRRLIGRLHPATTHFGIAWAVLAFAFALARIRFEGLGRADLAVAAAALAGAAIAALTGWIHAPDVMGRPGVAAIVELHRWTAIAVVGLLASALVARLLWERRPRRFLRVVYLVLLALAAGLVLYAGHLGGGITFGEGFVF
jgi:uncharacterized membrane protein